MEMKRECVTTPQAPAAVGPYSQGIKLGDLLFISGQLPLDPATGKIVDGDASAQARQSLTNLRAIAKEAGAALTDAVKTTVFVTDIKDFPAVNQVYAEFFAEPFPTRSTVQVAALPLGAAVEVEAIIKV